MRKRGKERKLENKKKEIPTEIDGRKRENTQKAVIASDRFFAYVCVVPQSCVYILMVSRRTNQF